MRKGGEERRGRRRGGEVRGGEKGKRKGLRLLGVA